jgi:uncharacterized membrane protein
MVFPQVEHTMQNNSSEGSLLGAWRVFPYVEHTMQNKSRLGWLKGAWRLGPLLIRMAHRGMKTRASVTRTSPLSKILCWTNMCVQLRDFQLGMNKQYFGRLVCTAHLFICAMFMGSAHGSNMITPSEKYSPCTLQSSNFDFYFLVTFLCDCWSGILWGSYVHYLHSLNYAIQPSGK